MFKRFWESLNTGLRVLGMDDPRGDYMFKPGEQNNRANTYCSDEFLPS
jgi:hypothetical protein